eukprot:Sdes_comp23454_c0_seq1m21700
MSDEDDILSSSCADLEEISCELAKLETLFLPVLEHGFSSLQFQESPSSEFPSELNSAKFDIINSYALDSLFWVYLNLNGVFPNEHPVRLEIIRVQNTLKKLKETVAKRLSTPSKPKISSKVAKRIVKHSLH